MAGNRKQRKESTVATRRKRETVLENISRSSSDRSRWLNFSIFLAFAVLYMVVCFLGLSPVGPILQEGQESRVRIISEERFEYTSEIETERKKAAERVRVPPVYRLDPSNLEAFETYLDSLNEELAKLQQNSATDGQKRSVVRPNDVSALFKRMPEGNPYGLRTTDLAVLMNQLPPEKRAALFEEGLNILRQQLQNGVYDKTQQEFANEDSNVRVYNLNGPGGEAQSLGLISIEEARRTLQVSIWSLDAPHESSDAIFRILKEGLAPNLEFDPELTQDAIDKALESVEPVTVVVEEGETIIEPGSRVSSLQLEKWEAYRRHRTLTEATYGVDAIFIERALLLVVIMFVTVLFLQMSGIRISANRRLIFLAGTTLLINFLLNRLVLELADSGVTEQYPILLTLLPYLIPVALAPMLISILLGSVSGFISAILLAFINALMQGSSLSVSIATIVTSLVAIYYCRNIKLRTRVVRAGFYSGIVMGVVAMLAGIRNSADFSTVVIQMTTAVSVGAMTGIAIIGILPIWEGLFRTTTDITLLELTDFNHPLLRRMQMEAPGSYHHSLMVANLAENAAAEIGANPLMCRVCALFHDIGKMVKPEYFTENQRDGYNPHLERNPSMSALIIKSHAKEGIVLAKQYKLPEVIIKVIQQHHGTSLIQYFYYKALERKRQADAENEIHAPNAPRVELDQVNEATYRYEGPTPDFIESAIIMLADSVEAAGRSLRKVTPQSIEELIDKIFTSRVEDSQLDQCPLTFQQLSKVRDSFIFTLLNMLHSRVEYPSDSPESDARQKKKVARKSSRSPFASLGEQLGAQSSESSSSEASEPTAGDEETENDEIAEEATDSRRRE